MTLIDAPPSRQSSVSLAAMLGQYEASPFASMSDGPLLRHFLAHRQEAAFTQMVRRHGPMVWRTCQRMLGHSHDADDAFQATFLVLARRAGTIHPPEMLGPWLHGVAYRCALSIKQQRGRRQSRELPFEETQIVNESPVEYRDWLPFLDQEIQKLPEIYRRPVVLCELEGRSRSAAASLLGISEGTLSSRLASARKKLAARLGKRGLLSVAALSSWAVWESSASAALPETLVRSTVGFGMNLLEHSATMTVPPQVAAASHGAMQSMFINQCKTLALVTASVGCLGYGCWLAGDVGAAESAKTPALSVVRPVQDDNTVSTTASDDPLEQAGSVNTTSQQNPPSSKANTSSGQQNSTSANVVSTTNGQQSRTSATASRGQVAVSGDVESTATSTGQNVDDDRRTRNVETITGSGKLATETRSISGVTGLQLLNAGKITIRQTGREKLTVTADDNLLPLLSTEVVNGTLVLKNTKPVNIQTKNDMTYVVEVKTLSKLTLQGAGTITVQGLKNEKLDLTLQGAGTVTLEGTASNLTIRMPGAGTVQASSLRAENASVSIAGSGSVTVHASDKLSASITGAGSIEYIGDPEVTRSIQGSGTVKKRTSSAK
ncbi:MAG: sigma-70 family RNA polymerase sigma factor [Gemmatales bacterium]